MSSTSPSWETDSFSHSKDSMEQSPSRETNRSSASQEIPHILWNPKAHYRSQALANRPYQSTPCPHTSAWRSILILSSHLRLRFPNDLFPLGLPTTALCAPLLSSIRATCRAHLILLAHIKEENKRCKIISLNTTLSVCEPAITRLNTEP